MKDKFSYQENDGLMVGEKVAAEDLWYGNSRFQLSIKNETR